MAAGKGCARVLALIVLGGMMLGACSSAPTPTAQTAVIENTPTATEQVVQRETVVAQPTAVPEATPTLTHSARTGAWVDQLILTEQPSAEAAVSRLQAHDIDLYASALSDAKVFETVKADPALSYTVSLGTSYEITCNPVAAFSDGRINPFGVARFREALNWLLDRNHIVGEIFGGLAAARYLPITTFFADYARYVDIARPLEARYAYNPDRARAQIAEVMEGMGAARGADGLWQYNGQPVTLIGLIRSEDQRRDLGDYVSGQLETMGFKVDRQYRTAPEAGPIWNQSDPAEGLWSFYTGGWANSSIVRDEAGNFAFLYTNLVLSSPLWQAYRPSPEFEGVAKRLLLNDFSTMEQRRQLFQEALPLALQDSVRIWLADQKGFTPQDARLQVAYDLAGGVTLSQLYPFTLRWKGQEGGVVRLALPDLLVAPWNPIAGSAWGFDAMPQLATGDAGVMADPYTGLFWPQRIEKAECVVKSGLPVGRSLDWVTLTFADKIEVPPQAWADWDAAAQTFVEAGQMPTPTLETNSRCTVTYPRDLWTTVQWHDGSPISPADFVMRMIMTFDPGKKASPIYDEAQVATVDAFLSTFRGVQIESTDPLVITTYNDTVNLDVEWMAWTSTWWPYYAGGQAPWSTVALGVMADAAGDLAFSQDRAGAQSTKLGKTVEWMSFIAGPSLDILKRQLDGASAQGSVVYTATLSRYLTPAEIAGRYANLTRWYQTEGHFWVGTGPFYLDKVFTTEKNLTLRRFEAYPDPATRWERFGTPMFPVVEVTGPAQVKVGSPATFDVSITFDGKPYPPDQIAGVHYLLFDASGSLASQGEATVASEGSYVLALTPEATGRLPAGSSKLEVVVTSNAVSVPTFAQLEFETSK